MRNLREVRWVTGAALGILLGGCSVGPSTRNVSWEPLPGSDRYSSSREATLTTDNAADLRARGYVLLGGLTVDQVVGRCDWGPGGKKCKPVPQAKDSTADLLEEAARRGGELVWLGEDRAERTRETGGTRCTRTKDNYTLTITHTAGGMKYTQERETVCWEWEKFLVLDNVRRSSGILYRLDPPRAKELKRQDEFLLAVLEGDKGKVGNFLDRGFRADSVDVLGVPVLGWAATGRDETLVDLLLSRGAKLEATCSEGTPLNMAARAGKEGMVRHLLEKGARVDSRDASGNTPLFNAAFAGHTAVVRILLEGGADPDARNDLGNTPLFAAITGRSAEEPKLEVGGDLWVQDPEIVRLLLAKGANPKAPNKAMRTPAEFAVMAAPASEAARFFVNYWFGATGYVDKAGAWVIRPRFRYTGDFHEGLAKVSPKGKNAHGVALWGFVDRTGRMAIPARFPFVGDFSQGLARASEELGEFGWEGMKPVTTVKARWGFLDTWGKWAIEPKFRSAGSFADGVAPVLIDGKGYIYIDRQGKQALPQTFAEAESFSDGVAKVKRDGQVGFIDRDGNWVLKKTGPKAPFPEAFTEGLGHYFASGRYELRGGMGGYMDKTGKTVIPPAPGNRGSFREGFAVASEEGILTTKSWFIDRSGKNAFGRTFDRVRYFSDGVALTLDEGTIRRKVAYIDHEGKDVLVLPDLSDKSFAWGPGFGSVEARSVEAGGFSEGLAPVRIAGEKFLSLWERKE